MRWSCPHCGIRLALADDKVGSEWEFSRCYSCGGFAMLRRSEIDLIKLDKAPLGERILLPESSETPMLSEEAATRYAQICQAPITTDSEVKPVTKRFRLERRHTLIAAMLGAGALALGSGLHFFLLGKELLDKANLALVASELKTATVAKAQGPSGGSVASAPSAAPTQLRPAGAEPAAPSAPVVAAAELTDSVSSRAMAPIRANDDSDGSQAPGGKLYVKARGQNVPLRSGPGLGFSMVGVADPNSIYTVTDWSDRWFRISVLRKGSPSATGAMSEAWIHNNEVQLIHQN